MIYATARSILDPMHIPKTLDSMEAATPITPAALQKYANAFLDNPILSRPYSKLNNAICSWHKAHIHMFNCG